ncbi:MAG: putative membrane protein [Chitinophagales bacterium]|jgi:uncharacterized membrane protein
MSNFKNFLATTFLGGLVVILPMAIFAILAKWVISFFDGIIDPISTLFPERWNEVLIKIFAFGIITAICFLIGLLVRTQFGNSMFNWVEEQALSRLPLYSAIKETVQQFFGKDKTAFSQVVLIEPFGNGVKMTGFVTEETSDGTLTVFTPTAPNPTNGYVFMVHKSEVEILKVKSEVAMKNILSLGAGMGKMVEQARENSKN